MSDMDLYITRSDEHLKELQSRRILLEKKYAMRLATIKEFEKLRHDSIDRLHSTLEKGRIEAIHRHEKLRKDISSSLHQLNGLGDKNKERLAQAKVNYQKKVDDLMPLWKRHQTIKIESKTEDLNRERVLVEERRQKFFSEAKKESEAMKRYESGKRLLIKSLVDEHHDHISAKAKNALMQYETVALEEYARRKMEELEQQLQEQLRNTSSSEQFHVIGEKLLQQYTPPPQTIFQEAIQQPVHLTYSIPRVEPQPPAPPLSAQLNSVSAHSMSQFITTKPKSPMQQQPLNADKSFDDQLTLQAVVVQEPLPSSEPNFPAIEKRNSINAMNQSTGSIYGSIQSRRSSSRSLDQAPTEQSLPTTPQIATQSNRDNSSFISPDSSYLPTDEFSYDSIPSQSVTRISPRAIPNPIVSPKQPADWETEPLVGSGVKPGEAALTLKPIFRCLEDSSSIEVVKQYKTQSEGSQYSDRLKVRAVWHAASSGDDSVNGFPPDVLVAAALQVAKEFSEDLFSVEMLNGIVSLEKVTKEHKRQGKGRADLLNAIIDHMKNILEADAYMDEIGFNGVSSIAEAFSISLTQHIPPADQSRVLRKVSNLLKMCILPKENSDNPPPKPPKPVQSASPLKPLSSVLDEPGSAQRGRYSSVESSPTPPRKPISYASIGIGNVNFLNVEDDEIEDDEFESPSKPPAIRDLSAGTSANKQRTNQGYDSRDDFDF